MLFQLFNAILSGNPIKHFAEVPGLWQAWFEWDRNNVPVLFDTWTEDGERSIHVGRCQMILTPWSVVERWNARAAVKAAERESSLLAA